MTADKLTILTLLLVCLLLNACQTQEKDRNFELPKGTIQIHDAWARPANQGMMGGAYLTIANGTGSTDTLLSVRSPAASMTEVHESYEENEISGMRPIEKLVIKAQTFTELTPGGLHIMMMDLGKNLSPGDTISVELLFSNFGTATVDIPVSADNPYQSN